MQALSFARKDCPDLLPVNIGKKISEGADGEVFELTDDPEKVVKFGIRYFQDLNHDLDQEIENIDRLLSSLINFPDPVCAQIFEFQFLGRFHSFTELSNHRLSAAGDEYALYWYSMEKLENLTEEENKVLFSLFSHEDRGTEKDLMDEERIFKMLGEMENSLEFDTAAIRLFALELRRSRLNHNDLDPRNIMKDKNGKFKLVDLDRATFKENQIAL